MGTLCLFFFCGLHAYVSATGNRVPLGRDRVTGAERSTVFRKINNINWSAIRTKIPQPIGKLVTERLSCNAPCLQYTDHQCQITIITYKALYATIYSMSNKILILYTTHKGSNLIYT